MFILYVVDDFVEPHHYDNDASMVVRHTCTCILPGNAQMYFRIIPARLNSKLMLSSHSLLQ